MHAPKALAAAIFLLSHSFSAAAAAAWGFGEATLSVQAKGAGVGGGLKEKYGEELQLPRIRALSTDNRAGSRRAKSSRNPLSLVLRIP